MARSSSRSEVSAFPMSPAAGRTVVAVQPLRRLDQDLLAAILVGTNRAKNEVRAVGPAQFAGQPDQPVGAHDGRMEAVEVDAGRNRLQPALEVGEALQRVARHVLRHGDYRVGPRLASLDETFRQAARHERRVQRGDPLDLEPAGERPSHPRGGR